MLSLRGMRFLGKGMWRDSAVSSAGCRVNYRQILQPTRENKLAFGRYLANHLHEEAARFETSLSIGHMVPRGAKLRSIKSGYENLLEAISCGLPICRAKNNKASSWSF
jgi:hypothetical protein